MAATEVFEELARADASVAWCVWNGNTYWTTARRAKEIAITQHIRVHPRTLETAGRVLFGLETGHTDTHAVILATAIGSCSTRVRASSRELCPTAFGRG